MAAQCASSQTELPRPPLEVDPEFPGTALARMRAVHARVAELAATAGALDGPWDDVRRGLLRAGGLRDLPHARPGEGYTGHAFNDWNHCDLTTMLDDVKLKPQNLRPVPLTTVAKADARNGLHRIHDAAIEGRAAEVDHQLSTGVDPDLLDEDGWTPVDDAEERRAYVRLAFRCACVRSASAFQFASRSTGEGPPERGP